MKKIVLNIIMVSLFSSFFFPFSVYAASNIETQGTEIQENNYGELKDGLFVKTIEEEVADIPKDSEIYFDEYSKALEAHMRESLTPEMEASGYVLINGIAYTAEEAKTWLEGDSGEGSNVIKITGTEVTSNIEIENFDENGNPVIDYGNGYVTFIATAHPDIHEVCFVEVTNTTSNKVYSFELYEQNSYNKSIQLPAGFYIVSGGGIKEDYTSKYPISEASFEVNIGATTVVTITIGNISEQELNEGIVIEQEQEEIITEQFDEEQTENKKVIIPSWFSFIISVLAICFIAIFFIYKNKKK